MITNTITTLSDALECAINDEDQQLIDELEEVQRQFGGADAEIIWEGWFEEYAVGVAEDVLGLDFSSWPLNRVDWRSAAWDLRMDYTEYCFGGVCYCLREI